MVIQNHKKLDSDFNPPKQIDLLKEFDVCFSSCDQVDDDSSSVSIIIINYN